MAETAGSLSFGFEADFSGFTRAAQSAGATLDQLARKADSWAGSTSNGLDATLGAAAQLQSGQAAALDASARAMSDRIGALKGVVVGSGGLSTSQVLAGTRIADLSGDKDDDSATVLTHLSEQLALLKTTGTEHDAIIDRMRTEAAQAKLGSDATQAEKDSVASLVQQIDAASAAQAKLKVAAAATTQAWSYGGQQIASGLESMIFDGASLGSAAAGVLRSLSDAGLSAALAGTGPFAALFGTSAGNTDAGGLFGVLGRALTGTGATPSISFAGAFAEGGSIGLGEWGIVGEKGAEVVAGPAAVTPWAKLPAAAGQRSTQVINFNVTSPDAPSFARSQSQMASLLSRMVARGQRNM